VVLPLFAPVTRTLVVPAIVKTSFKVKRSCKNLYREHSKYCELFGKSNCGIRKGRSVNIYTIPTKV
jgi:hypothetical protein